MCSIHVNDGATAKCTEACGAAFFFTSLITETKNVTTLALMEGAGGESGIRCFQKIPAKTCQEI